MNSPARRQLCYQREEAVSTPSLSDYLSPLIEPFSPPKFLSLCRRYYRTKLQIELKIYLDQPGCNRSQETQHAKALISSPDVDVNRQH